MTIIIKNRILGQKYLVLFSLVLIALVLFLWPSHSYAAMDPVWKVLKDYQVTDTLGNKVYGIWNIFIKLTNGFVVVVLIAVAFAQILRLNINTYGVKKVLPTLVLAIIAANFSFLFCRLLVDFSSVIISLFLQGTDGTKTNASDVVGSLSNIASSMSTLSGKPCISDGNPAGCYGYVTLFWYSIANLMIFAGAIVILILAYLFIIRNWMIYFLVAFAPLAFMALILPQTKALFNQWWTNFSKWVFMPVVSVFWIWVGSLWFAKIGEEGTFMSFIFAGVCFYLAITTPFKMGGAVMGAWGKFGKTAWGKTGGAAWNSTGGLIGKGIKAGVNNYWDTQKGHIARKIEGTKLGQRYSAVRDKGKVNQELSKTMLEKQRGDSYRKQALQKLYSKTPAEWNRVSEDAHGRLKKLVGAGVNDEYGNPSYKDQYSIDKLTKSEYQNATTGALASAYDFANPENLRKWNGTAWTDLTAEDMAKIRADGGLSAFEAHAASYKEIIRRSKMRSHQDNDTANDAITSLGLNPNIDSRIMAGTSAVGTPSGGGQAMPPSIADHADKLKELAGDKTGEILERAMSATNMQDISIDDLVGGMSTEAKAGVFGYLKGMGEMIEKQMESAGNKESIEGLDTGFYRIKSMLFKPGAVNNVDKLIEQVTSETNQSQLPGGKESLTHALDALKLTQSKGHTSIPIRDFDNFKNEMIGSEIGKQRMAVVQGSSLGQGTVRSLASVGANVPLENLSIETALTHLNRNIEKLTENTHDIAHSSAAPMGEMRGAGIGAIADREAFKQLLKESQSGIKDDLKGAMQGVFSQGYTGKDTLSNPAVARIFAQEISTRLSQRLSKTPLQTKITNIPKTGEVPHQTTTIAPPSPTTTQPPARIAPSTPSPNQPLKMPPKDL